MGVGYTLRRVDAHEEKILEYDKELKQIISMQTDIQWIKKTTDEIQKTLKNHIDVNFDGKRKED